MRPSFLVFHRSAPVTPRTLAGGVFAVTRGELNTPASVRARWLAPWVAAGAALGLCAHAPAQVFSSCASDGEPAPRAVVERFISADCTGCWEQPPAVLPGPGALVVDWIVPTPQGDAAPLSAAATRDALMRLDAIQRPVPQATDTFVADMAHSAHHPAGAARLRLARGPAVNDYVGMSLRFTPGAGENAGPYQLTVLLVEAIAAGAAHSKAERYLVRNSFTAFWNADKMLSKKEQSRWTELRSMWFDENALPDRLRLVGWVQDARGRVVVATQAVCRP